MGLGSGEAAGPAPATPKPRKRHLGKERADSAGDGTASVVGSIEQSPLGSTSSRPASTRASTRASTHGSVSVGSATRPEDVSAGSQPQTDVAERLLGSRLADAAGLTKSVEAIGAGKTSHFSVKLIDMYGKSSNDVNTLITLAAWEGDDGPKETEAFCGKGKVWMYHGPPPGVKLEGFLAGATWTCGSTKQVRRAWSGVGTGGGEVGSKVEGETWASVYALI